TAFITKGAVALGLMGSNDGLAPLVLLAREAESADSVAAFDSIFILTGRNYGYSVNTSIARRRQLIAELNQWFETEGHNFRVYPEEVERRSNSEIDKDTTQAGTLR